MTLEFAWPWVFAALPLPLLVGWLLPRAEQTLGPALRIPFYTGLEPTFSAADQRHARGWVWLAGLTWLLLVTAAARPQLIGEPVQLPMSGRDLMLAVDISGSMASEDMQLQGREMDRLMAVKLVAGQFIERRKGDRIGLILFGRQAYLQAPLTFDRKTVHTLLGEAAVGLAGRETAIGDAIGLAVKRLREQPEQDRVLILLTDGANTAGAVDPLKAADLAAQEGVRIYTIGVGADSQLVRGLFGARRIANTDLDESTLKAIATKTGGRYFRARDLRSLEQIYGILDQLEPVEKEEETYRPIDELFRWPLGLALLLTFFLALGRGGGLLPTSNEVPHG